MSTDSVLGILSSGTPIQPPVVVEEAPKIVEAPQPEPELEVVLPPLVREAPSHPIRSIDPGVAENLLPRKMWRNMKRYEVVGQLVEHLPLLTEEVREMRDLDTEAFKSWMLDAPPEALRMLMWATAKPYRLETMRWHVLMMLAEASPE